MSASCRAQSTSGGNRAQNDLHHSKSCSCYRANCGGASDIQPRKVVRPQTTFLSLKSSWTSPLGLIDFKTRPLALNLSYVPIGLCGGRDQRQTDPGPTANHDDRSCANRQNRRPPRDTHPATTRCPNCGNDAGYRPGAGETGVYGSKNSAGADDFARSFPGQNSASPAHGSRHGRSSRREGAALLTQVLETRFSFWVSFRIRLDAARQQLLI